MSVGILELPTDVIFDIIALLDTKDTFSLGECSLECRKYVLSKTHRMKGKRNFIDLCTQFIDNAVQVHGSVPSFQLQSKLFNSLKHQDVWASLSRAIDIKKINITMYTCNQDAVLQSIQQLFHSLIKSMSDLLCSYHCNDYHSNIPTNSLSVTVILLESCTDHVLDIFDTKIYGFPCI